MRIDKVLAPKKRYSSMDLLDDLGISMKNDVKGTEDRDTQVRRS